MIGNSTKLVYALALAGAVCLAAPGETHAQWRIYDLNPFNPASGVNQSLREFDKARLNAMAPGFRAGRDYTKVYAKNETDKPIWVAVIDIPFVVIQGNETVMDDPNVSPWHVHAWYKVAPGDRLHVSNTSNRNVYVYAQNESGTLWEGNVTHEVPDNGTRRLVQFRKESFNDMPEEFNVRFTP